MTGKTPYCSPTNPAMSIVTFDDSTPDSALSSDGFSRGYDDPRDFDEIPFCGFANAQPFSLPMLTEREVKERIEERERTGNRLRDKIKLAGRKIKNQNGIGYCHDEKSEVLTERGWVRWSDYNWSDQLGTMNPRTGNLEFQSPFERHVYEYRGEMVHSTNRRIDFGVTPDHRMLVRKFDESRRTLSPEFTFQKAGELGWYFGMPHATNGFVGTELKRVAIPGDREYDGDDFVRLLAIISSDGFAGGSEKTWNLVSFSSFKPKFRERVVGLSDRLGFVEQPSRPGVWNRWGAGALAEWVRANVYGGKPYGAHTKIVPFLVKCASERQIKIFLDWFGDKSDSRSEGRHFYSASRRMADDLQELLLRIGRRGTISSRDPRTSYIGGSKIESKGTQYTVVEDTQGRLSIDRKKHLERDDYNGLVYCAGVPNGTLVTRRNGSVLVSGNCWGFCAASAVETRIVAQGSPFVSLSPASVCAPIVNFANRGGWPTKWLEWAGQNGIATSEHWPDYNRDRGRMDDPGVLADRMLYVPTEVVDFDVRGNREQAWWQAICCMVCDIPVCVGQMHWGHAVMLTDPVISSSGEIGNELENSWKESWGDGGYGRQFGSKKYFDEGVGVFTVKAVPATAA